ncbi:MAG TPA: 3-dehydroquinate synthase [Flavitalea sp.]|nr:3-dehydroquinate synthase [Flavitalea sp.]
MKKSSLQFTTKKVDYYFDASFADIDLLIPKEQQIYITDENIFQSLSSKFKGRKLITVPAGEAYKNQSTVDSIILQLMELGADRQSFLIGIGGGVVTDLTGYVATVYMRGVQFGFVPTTVLAMVDASIGGKNGVDVGAYKNLVGTIQQPAFLLYDVSLLKTLPIEEWVNGFAEIIKHAAIRDAKMFAELEAGTFAKYRRDKTSMSALIRRNALLKSKVVQEDEFEKSIRRLLNFGHTIGHAIETNNKLSHGHAVAIGMVEAAKLSAELKKFRDAGRLTALIDRYGLPTEAYYDKVQAVEMLRMDKKKVKSSMNFVLLEKIGKAVVEPIPLDTLEELIKQL